MICDAHSHILHEMDSGATSLSQAVALTQASIDQGICAIILCPAYNPRQHISHFLLKRDRQILDLTHALGDKKDCVHLIPAAEVPLVHDLVTSPELEKLLLPATRYLPCTLPIGQLDNDTMSDIVYLTQKRRIYPYFLHMERYLTFYTPSEIHRLTQIRNCLWGVSVRSLCERSVSQEIMRMLVEGKTVLISSNAHDPTFMSPEMRKEHLRIVDTYAERVYDRLIKIGDAYVKKLMPYWKRRGY